MGYKSLAQIPAHRNRPVSSNVRRMRNTIAVMLWSSHLQSFSSVKTLPSWFAPRTAHLSVGRPSFGGQRTVCVLPPPSFLPAATLARCCAVARWRTHRRAISLGVRSRSVWAVRPLVGRAVPVARCGTVERVRVCGFGLYAPSPRPHGPNPSFNLTFSGLRPPNAG